MVTLGMTKSEMTKDEGMTNDQMPNDRHAASSSLGLRHSFGIRYSSFVISCVILLLIQMCCSALAQGQSPNPPRDQSVRQADLAGKWNVEVTFGQARHTLRFEARPGGTGSLLLTDPQAKAWGAVKPSEAKWLPGKDNSVSFSGDVEFMLGNVGRDAGTLVFTGKFETPDLITGEVEFSPLVGDRPSKHGTFKAARNM
jgi:hypothetical protein